MSLYLLRDLITAKIIEINIVDIKSKSNGANLFISENMLIN